jgi:hypothetical protein
VETRIFQGDRFARMKLVFLLEESSMREVLEILLPCILPENITFDLVPHEGKNDLERSIPKKLRAMKKMDWRTQQMTRFVILRDNDNANCLVLKKRLVQLCEKEERADCLIRLVCQSLESWYLGDLNAVAVAFEKPKIATRANEAKFRNPDDKIPYPETELRKLIGRYKKIGDARRIAPHLNPKSNASKSFRIFVEGVCKVVGTLIEQNER